MKESKISRCFWLKTSVLLLTSSTTLANGNPLIVYGEDKVTIECSVFNYLEKSGVIDELNFGDKYLEVRGSCNEPSVEVLQGLAYMSVTQPEPEPEPDEPVVVVPPINPIGPWCACPDEEQIKLARHLFGDEYFANLSAFNFELNQSTDSNPGTITTYTILEDNLIEPIDWSGAIDVQVPVHKEILIDSLAWPRVKDVQVPVYKLSLIHI